MTDLSALFATDPHDLQPQDIDQIIKEMRASRHQFKQGNTSAGKTKPKTEKEKQGAAVAAQLSLKDLGI